MKMSRLLVLACAATLMCDPLAVVADDGAAQPDERRPIVLAQATQQSKTVLSAQCREGQVRRCNTVEGKQKCACVTEGKSPRAKAKIGKSTRPVIRID